MSHAFLLKLRYGFLPLLLLFLAAAGTGITAARAESAVPSPAFSKPSGFYDDPFELTVLTEEGLSVYFTLDGSTPDETDSLYAEPLTIRDVSEEPNMLSARTDIWPSGIRGEIMAPPAPVDKATVIRAVAVDGEGNRSDVSTAVFFVGFQDKSFFYDEFTVVSLILDEGDLFDDARGIYVLGDAYKEWRDSGDYDPDLSDWQIPANYMNRGREWERQAYMQIFDQGRERASAEVGIRIHGATSRCFAQKSFNIYTRKKYGTEPLRCDLFNGDNRSEATGEPITEYDSFVLRNCGGDRLARIRNQLVQNQTRGRGFITQAAAPCVVFINGEFWGHYEITEKLTNSFIRDHFGVSKKNVVLVKNEEIEEGTGEDAAALAELRKWIRETDFSDAEAYEELGRLIDLDGLAEYISTEFYIANWDFGDNNVALWKARDPDPENEWADGKWRFILFDVDYSEGIYGEAAADMDAVERLRGMNCIIADFFFGAMGNPDFRERFSEVYENETKDDFAYGRVSDAIDELDGVYREAVLATNSRFWPDWSDDEDEDGALDLEFQEIREFFAARQEYSDAHVAKLMSQYN